jgi:tripartite-type tricarboxylate transporter receptor subunit TctC
MGGSLAFTFVDLGNALGQAKGGKLRGSRSPRRSDPARARPAGARRGAEGYELIAWFALMAPAKTPADVVQKVHDAAVKSLAKPEVKEEVRRDRHRPRRR